MSETQPVTEIKKGYPADSVKTLHVSLDAFKLNANIGYGKTGKGVKITYEDGDWGSKTTKIPEGKFSEAALKVPANKKLWIELQDSALKEDDAEATLVFLKGAEYWNLTGIKAGHHGVAGIVKPLGEASAQPQATAVSSGYDNTGARTGNLLNNSVAILVAQKSKDFSADAIVAKAAELNAVCERIKNEVVLASPAQAKALDDSDLPEPPVSDDDEDVPF